MIDIREVSFLKYYLFGSLYFTEGLSKVIGVMILPLYFLEKGVPPEIITATISLAAAPMIIKFVWAGIADFFIHRGRKKFIILGGALSILAFIMVIFIDPGEALIPFALLVTLCWTGVGFLDVSADAWAIEISKEYERGKINGAMYAGQNMGMVIGALIFPFVVQTYGYNLVFIIAALLIFLILLFPLLVDEIKIVKKRPKIFHLLKDEFKKKTTIIACLFASTYGFNAGMLLFIAPIYMNISLQLDVTQIGFITMAFTLATTIGSLTGGFLADLWDRKKTIYVFFAFTIVFSALLITTNSWENFILLYSIIGFLQGGYIAPHMALFMDITNPKIGATQYSIFMGLGNFGQLGIASISGSLYAMFGFNHVFLYAAWACGPTLLILRFFRIKKSQ